MAISLAFDSLGKLSIKAALATGDGLKKNPMRNNGKTAKFCHNKKGKIRTPSTCVITNIFFLQNLSERYPNRKPPIACADRQIKNLTLDS